VAQIGPPTPPSLPPKDRAPDSPAGLAVFAIGVALLFLLR
jgi:hypothetical protein